MDRERQNSERARERERGRNKERYRERKESETGRKRKKFLKIGKEKEIKNNIDALKMYFTAVKENFAPFFPPF